MSHPLESLRLKIAESNNPDHPLEFIRRLTVVTVQGLHHVEFYGDAFTACADLADTLMIPEVAENLVSLSFRGPDEGANGTRNWDLEPLVAGNQNFPRLQTFSVELNKPGDHNRTIIASSYDEDGVIAKFVRKCPRLVNLQIPSAPSPDFFDVPLAALQILSVDAGYDTQDFIRHFASSEGYPSLRTFEWGEYSERYMDDWQSLCTPFADYETLFVSVAFSSIRHFIVRQPALTEHQLKALKALHPETQIQVIRYSDEFL